MLEWNAVYLLLAVALVAVLTEKALVMPLLALLAATGLYGVMQGGAPPWTAGEFGIGFGQAIAAAGLAVAVGAMLAEWAATAGAGAWLAPRLSPRARQAGIALFGLLAGLGGQPVAALAILAPLLRAAGIARARLTLTATAMINAAQGSLLPAPLPVAALTILDGDWRRGLLFGLLAALAQGAVGILLARRGPPGAAMAETAGTAAPRARAGLALPLLTLALIALLIAQSLGQIAAEPFGGGPIRENLLGAGRPMLLAWVGLGGALLLFGGWRRGLLGEDGPLARGLAVSAGLVLTIGTAGGFGMILHNSGMAVVVAEAVPRLGAGLPAGLALAVPFLIALVSRALQGSPLTATLTAAGMMQPLLAPLGLGDGDGRVLAALAVGAGSMALPHVNDGYFWLANHLAGFRAAEGLRRVSGGALVQALAGLAVLMALAAAR
ncbi:hypothetical protein [Phaeospirillum tilakii]|uniref:Gluconate:H+ symporter, GntP family n=1 Tax=Phaeospirillum tilakii TaxID=741673 RepID=A0ABW5CAV0_9PROT